jgi:excisionase family DNA binding protein
VSPAALLVLEAFEDPEARRKVVALLLPEILAATPAAPATGGRLSTRDAAARAGCSAKTVREPVHRGDLSATRHGKGFTFDLADVDRWIETGRVRHPARAKKVSSLTSARRSASLVDLVAAFDTSRTAA